MGSKIESLAPDHIIERSVTSTRGIVDHIIEEFSRKKWCD